MYYLRTKAAADAIKFTVEQSSLKPQVLNNEDALVVELSNAGTIDKKVIHILVPENDPAKINLPAQPSATEQISCSLDNPEGCPSCSA